MKNYTYLYFLVFMTFFACSSDDSLMDGSDDYVQPPVESSRTPVEFDLGGSSFTIESSESKTTGYAGIDWAVGDTILIAQYQVLFPLYDMNIWEYGELLDFQRYTIARYSMGDANDTTRTMIEPVDEPLYLPQDGYPKYYVAVYGGDGHLGYGDSRELDSLYVQKRNLASLNYDAPELNYNYDILFAGTLVPYDESERIPLHFKHSANQFDFTVIDYENSGVSGISLKGYFPVQYRSFPQILGSFGTGPGTIEETNPSDSIRYFEDLPLMNVTDEAGYESNFRGFLLPRAYYATGVVDYYFTVYFDDGTSVTSGIPNTENWFRSTFNEPGYTYNFRIAINHQGTTKSTSGKAQRSVEIVSVEEGTY